MSILSADQRPQYHENSCTEKLNAEMLHKPTVDGVPQVSLCSSSTGLCSGITVWVQSQLTRAMSARVGTQANKLLGLILSFKFFLALRVFLYMTCPSILPSSKISQPNYPR